jgi:hypothetical protein
MLHLGLLITKDDDEIVGPWFRENGHYFDEIVWLDGSRTDHTRRAAAAEPNVVYVHERTCGTILRTDQGLRDAAHRILVSRHGHQGWITLCHSDEFFYHNPRKCAELAETETCDGIRWYALHFLPHPNELPHREYLRRLPAHLRFRYYHWDYEGTGVPWLEFRSFRNHSRIRWQPAAHGSPQPAGCAKIAEFHPAYCHFKVFSLDPSWYAPESGWTRFAHHWQDVERGKTGLNWPADSIEELFVDHYAPYHRCDLFRGVFEQGWNIGEQYR